MQKNIHPKTHLIEISCACGNTFETLSTSKEIKVEVCSSCHPFFTGTQRFVDTAGRVERFKAKLEAQKSAVEEAKAKKAAKKTKAVKKTESEKGKLTKAEEA